jgi:hypothetical protein
MSLVDRTSYAALSFTHYETTRNRREAHNHGVHRLRGGYGLLIGCFYCDAKPTGGRCRSRAGVCGCATWPVAGSGEGAEGGAFTPSGAEWRGNNETGDSCWRRPSFAGYRDG